MTSQNERDRFNWLHFGNWLGRQFAMSSDAEARHWKALHEDLALLHDEMGPWDAVFITGDVARDGFAYQYESVTNRIRELLERLSKLGSAPVVLTVPGAHDAQRASGPELVFLLKVLESKTYDLELLRSFLWSQDDLGRDFRKQIQAAFNDYDLWFQGPMPARPEAFKTGELPGDFTATIPLGTKLIGVAGLNTSIVQRSDESDSRGRLPLDPLQLRKACHGHPDDWAARHDVCILLTHHPPSWLGPESRWAFYGEIAPPSRFTLQLCSQPDRSGPNCVSDGPTLLVQAPPFTAEGTSGYIAGTVSLSASTEEVTLRPRRYKTRPKAKFVSDPSFSPDSLIAYRQSVRRTMVSPFPRTTRRPSEAEPQSPLRLRFLEIQNFRCFNRISISFEQRSRLPGQWTCLAGINGAGKSSFLQALALVLLGEPFHRELGGDRLARLRRVAEGIQQETQVRCWIQWGSSPRYIEVKYGDNGSAAVHPGSVYPQAMLKLWEELRSQVVLAYGATRNLSEFVDSRHNGLIADVRRVMTLFDPLTQVTSAELLLDKHTTARTPLLRLFKPLLRQVFGDDLGVDFADGRFIFTARDGPREAIDLPDGFRSSIAWLADLCATWCEKFPERAANGDPSDIEAIVLIDEIDLHLHPSLQRILVPRLREALPKVQWVVTTHSPLVLSSFDTAEIVALDRDEPGGVRFLDRQILGFTTDQIYEWLMGTTPTSAAMEQELSRNGTPGPHSEEEFVELLMTSPDVSAEEARDRARQLRERVERLSR
jgi:hypothetical protein